MKETNERNIPEVLRQALPALPMSVGLTLTLLIVLGISGSWPTGIAAAITAMLCCTLMQCFSTAAIAIPAAGVVSAAAWLFLGGGIALCGEMVTALQLQLQGMEAILPLYALPVSICIGILCGIFASLASMRPFGILLSIVALAFLLLLCWQFPGRSLLLAAALAAASLMVVIMGGAHPLSSPGKALTVTLATLLAAVLLIPADGIVIEPLKEQADALRQRILDTFFFNSPRDVFTLASEGFYPQGVSQLGGKVSLINNPVMEVQTPKVTYLRGVVRNTYTGRSWVDTISGHRYQWMFPRWRTERSAFFDSALPVSVQLPTEQVTVTMLDSNTSSLFVPQRIRNLSVSGDMIPYFNASSEVFITRNLQEGDTYTVYAALATGNDPGIESLVNACAGKGNAALLENITRVYTELPDHLQNIVFSMAHDITDGADTPFAKAYAIQEWLRSNCTYTLDVAPQPEDMDFVTCFLLQTREGYCTYFASAMTVLCRMVGLPARYVEGYVARPNADGIATVTGANAHAWTEVYFDGFGWLTFEPTASANRDGEDNESRNASPNPEGDTDDDEDPSDNDPAPTPTPEPSEEPPQQQEQDTESSPSPEPSEEPDVEPENIPQQPPASPENPQGHDGSNFPWLPMLALLLLLAAIAFRFWWVAPAQTARRKAYPRDQYLVWLAALESTAAMQKQSRQSDETVLQYLLRLRLPDEAYESSAVLYSNSRTADTAIQHLSAAYAERFHALTNWEKFRLLTKRFFTGIRIL